MSPSLNSTASKTVVFEPNFSVFKGKEYLKGYVRQVVLSDEKSSLQTAKFLLDLFKNFKILSDVLKNNAKTNGVYAVNFSNLLYNREHFGNIYRFILEQVENGVNSYEELFKNKATYNYESLAFAVTVFDELGFIKEIGEKIVVDKTVKKQLTTSLIYQNVLKIIKE